MLFLGFLILKKIGDFKMKNREEEDKIKDLGNKICRLVKYYEKGEEQSLALAALADVLLGIKGVFKSYDKRIRKLEDINRLSPPIYRKIEKIEKELKMGGVDQRSVIK